MIASVSDSAALVGSSSVSIAIITVSAMRVCGSNSVSSFFSFSFQPLVSITATTMAWHDGTLLVLCQCGGIQPQRLATFVWYLL